MQGSIAQRLLVGIDDTDNLESRGTGFRAREFGRQLMEEGLASVRGISRHQLYVHPDIPYTSHNSALCLDIDWNGGPLDTSSPCAATTSPIIRRKGPTPASRSPSTTTFPTRF